jgi:hypothetical protein
MAFIDLQQGILEEFAEAQASETMWVLHKEEQYRNRLITKRREYTAANAARNSARAKAWDLAHPGVKREKERQRRAKAKEEKMLLGTYRPPGRPKSELTKDQLMKRKAERLSAYRKLKRSTDPEFLARERQQWRDYRFRKKELSNV